jgi:chorismate mutase / prephenate dehydratase
MADRGRQVNELREQIGRLDLEIRDRLDQRARLSQRIHATLEGESSFDFDEKTWLDRIALHSTGDIPEASLRAIFREIGAAARAIESPVRVAVAGPEGGFCHQSSLEVFGATAQTTEFASVPEALAEVIRGRAVFAILPFESSVDGLMPLSLLALAETDLVLVGERYTKATYQLMSAGAELASLEKVYMTAIAHAACQRFLDAELPRVSIIDVRSPQVAAELAKESATSAAVLPERCGTAAGLITLRENVGETPDLVLRHGIAGSRPAARSGRDVSCLLFSTNETPSALYDVLRHLAERGITLRRLQSLPVRRDGIEYLFYVEISGHASDRSVVTALEAVRRSVRYYRMLGSFPAQR